MTRQAVCVDVATVWSSPDAPRPIDEPAVRDLPDVARWVQALDPETRMGLHGRTLTQLMHGEPVDVLQTGPAGWLQVAAPWQPVPEYADGYHGWIRAAHVSVSDAESAAADRPVPQVSAEPLAILDEARQFLGLQYLWGGTSPWGLDCSGLVHFAHRRAGVVVPRDAYAQHAAAEAVPLGEETPGDLYFFAREDGRVFHVGFVTGPDRMLHAPETGGGGLIEDAPLPESRRATLVAAGRFNLGS
jgi:cell wall-associated NlpC family hydrolase